MGAAENSEKQLEYHKVQLLEAALMRVFRIEELSSELSVQSVQEMGRV